MTAPSPTAPIGVFDSGVGGLTVLKAIRERLPSESLVYLGDTARVPYGTRSPETVVRYSQRVASRLVREDIKALVIACNTATAHALEHLQRAGETIGLPVLGVIEPGVQAALQVTQGGRVAVLGTEGTVRAGRYQAALEAAGVHALGQACSLFVPLAEEGWTSGEVAEATALRYLGHLLGQVDTAILGCTHFPLLREVIEKALPGVSLVDSAQTTALALEQILRERGLMAPERTPEPTRYLVTDNLERFAHVGLRFLGQRPQGVMLVDLPDPEGAFAAP
ncbi:MAG: glutamate racemase [Myxococcota bacterium]|nr:glutamate racemase [Myxococcota bacterium]